MTSISNIKTSYIALIIIMVYSLVFNEYWKSWKKNETPFVHDVDQYYSYLPAAFIHHDLSFKYPHHGYWLTKAPNGAMVAKGTCGMALMYMPFFFLGHKVAINSGDDLDGYSDGYKTCIHFGSLFYSFLGFFFLRKILRVYFSENVTAISLISVFFGTNIFYYVLCEELLPHNFLFCLSTIYIWLIIKWHEHKRLRYSIGIGFLTGLITLIRPSEVIFGIIFLLYGITSFKGIKQKFHELRQYWKHLVFMAFFFFLAVSPQLIYWKCLTDNFLFFSYGNGERFFFEDPKILEVLFSYRKGWLLYTPLMAFSIIGIFLSRKFFPKLFIPFIIYFVIQLYVISSWWCWWYGGGFGMRAIVQSYGILAFFIAGFLKYISVIRAGVVKSITTYFVIGIWSFLGCLNLLQIYQYKNGLIHYDAMTKETYWLVFGKSNLYDDEPAKYWNGLKSVDYEKAKLGERD